MGTSKMIPWENVHQMWAFVMIHFRYQILNFGFPAEAEHEESIHTLVIKMDIKGL